MDLPDHLVFPVKVRYKKPTTKMTSTPKTKTLVRSLKPDYPINFLTKLTK